MSNLRELPDLAQLKKWKVMDSRSYKEMVSALEKNHKVLILAAKNSGKNTVQCAVVNHFHRLHRDPLVIPPIEGVPANKFKSNLKVKHLKKLIKNFDSYVASIQYLGNSKSDISELTESLLPHFDLIIDLRNLDGERVICNLIKGRKKVNYIYSNPQFKKYLAG